jgi:hypothetical protein
MCCASLLETVTEKPATGALLAPTEERRTRRRTMKYICLGYIEPGTILEHSVSQRIDPLNCLNLMFSRGKQ